MDEVTVEVEVEVNPTEDPHKVTTAVKRVMGELELEIVRKDDRTYLRGRSEGVSALEKFHDLLRRERILDAARRVMFKGLREKTITFYLNKQVALVGHVSFSQPEKESPLGPIVVRIHSDSPRELLDWLTPRTA